MKTHLYKLLITVLIFTTFSCDSKKNSSVNNNCCKDLQKMETKNTCANNTSVDYKDEDLMMRFDCSNDSTFQHMHIDIKNRFGILGNVTMRGEIMDSIKIRKKEVGTCENYILKSCYYVGSIAINSNKQKIHYLKAEININPNCSKGRDIGVYTNINVSKNDIIDIFIKSDDPNLKSKIPKYNNISSNSIEEYIELVENNIVNIEPLTNYGQQFCKSRIVNGN